MEEGRDSGERVGILVGKMGKDRNKAAGGRGNTSQSFSLLRDLY